MAKCSFHRLPEASDILVQMYLMKLCVIYRKERVKINKEKKSLYL